MSASQAVSMTLEVLYHDVIKISPIATLSHTIAMQTPDPLGSQVWCSLPKAAMHVTKKESI